MRQRRTLTVLLLLLPALALAHPQDQAAPALALVHCTLHQPRPRLPVARLATGTSSSDMQPPNWLPPRPFVVYVTPAVPVPSEATSSTDKTARALGRFHAKVSQPAGNESQGVPIDHKASTSELLLYIYFIIGGRVCGGGRGHCAATGQAPLCHGAWGWGFFDS